MSARSVHEAESEYLAQLRQILSCLTPAVLSRSPVARQETGGPFVAVLNRGDPVRVAGSRALWLYVEMQYVVERRGVNRAWSARTTGYIYAVQAAGGFDLLAYHWHPNGPSHSPRGSSLLCW